MQYTSCKFTSYRQISGSSGAKQPPVSVKIRIQPRNLTWELVASGTLPNATNFGNLPEDCGSPSWFEGPDGENYQGHVLSLAKNEYADDHAYHHDEFHVFDMLKTQTQKTAQHTRRESGRFDAHLQILRIIKFHFPISGDI